MKVTCWLDFSHADEARRAVAAVLCILWVEGYRFLVVEERVIEASCLRRKRTEKSAPVSSNGKTGDEAEDGGDSSGLAGCYARLEQAVPLLLQQLSFSFRRVVRNVLDRKQEDGTVRLGESSAQALTAPEAAGAAAARPLTGDSTPLAFSASECTSCMGSTRCSGS